jgi:hypothetical protein
MTLRITRHFKIIYDEMNNPDFEGGIFNDLNPIGIF